MQPIDPSVATPTSHAHEALRKPAAAPEERHWAAGFFPILVLLVGPVALWIMYLIWRAEPDVPWKRPFWGNAELNFSIVLWLGLLLFTTFVSIALGDFERLFRHLFRRSRS